MSHRRKIQELKDVDKKIVDSKSELVKPLEPKDGRNLQEMIDLSNTYATLLKQYNQYDVMITVLKKRKAQFISGELKPPVMITISHNMSYAENDKEKIINYFNQEINNLEIAKSAAYNLVQHRQDEFMEAVIRIHRFLGEKVKDREVTKVRTARQPDAKTAEEEKKLLEKELDELNK